MKFDNFTPLFDRIVAEHGHVTAAAFGVVWRYCQMQRGQCDASVETMAARLGISSRTMQRHLKTLCDSNWLVDLTPDRRNIPHIYISNAEVKLSLDIERFGTTESQTGTTESQTGTTESRSGYDRESYRGTTESRMKIHDQDTKKKDTKKDNFKFLLSQLTPHCPQIAGLLQQATSLKQNGDGVYKITVSPLASEWFAARKNAMDELQRGARLAFGDAAQIEIGVE